MSTTHDRDIFPASLRGRRILLCVESFGPINGVSRTNLNLVNHLRAHGALVAVVAPYNHTKVNTFCAQRNDDPDGVMRCQEVRVTGYPLPFNPELSVVYPVRLFKLYEKTFGCLPDLIYLGSPASLGFQIMLQLQQQPREAQVPLICNFQTDLGAYCKILFPKPLGGFANWLFSVVQGYLFRQPSVNTVFYPSTFVGKYLKGEVGVPEDKMAVLRRGVDTEGFSPSKRSEKLRREWAPDGQIILLTCSRLAGEKGFAFLAEAAKELDARGFDFKLVIVGGNRNPTVEQEVKDLFAPLSLRGKVVFTGFRVGEELMTHYASADIFLHCSVTETFGLVVLEAMASGVPVIARDEGGPSDTIEHGAGGFLVPPRDLHGFVDHVVKLATDGPLREQFRRQARAQAAEAKWERIGNTVAWKMAEAIERREEEQAEYQLAADNLMRSKKPMLAWVLASAAVRRLLAAKMVNIKLAWAFSLVFSFWSMVSVYLLLIEVVHSAKDRVPRLFFFVRSLFR